MFETKACLRRTYLDVVLVALQAIRFSPCSPGQIIEMCKFLGVDSDREFYLLAVVRRAVVAPFPEDWAVGSSP